MHVTTQLKKKTGAMLVAAGIFIRIYTRQMFCKYGFEITPEQFVILEILAERDGLYQRQISEITLKDRPNVSRILNILEKKEFIKKSEDTNKRKIFKLFITEKGRELYEKMAPKVKEIRSIYIEGVDKNDLNTCINVLAKVQENLLDKVNMQI